MWAELGRRWSKRKKAQEAVARRSSAGGGVDAGEAEQQTAQTRTMLSTRGHGHGCGSGNADARPWRCPLMPKFRAPSDRIGVSRLFFSGH